MKPTVLSQHINFFQKHGFIEFEDIFSLERMNTFFEDTRNYLESKSKICFSDISFLQSYKYGRDFWRFSDKAFAIIKEKDILEIIHLLCKKDIFRIAFDQILKISGCDFSDINFLPNSSLEKTSSIQPLLAGVIICVKKEKEDFENHDLIFPQKEGNILIIAPSFVMPFQSLIKLKNSLYYLIGYAPISSQYVENKADIHTNDCKRYGYGFGDVLKDKSHPILQNKNKI